MKLELTQRELEVVVLCVTVLHALDHLPDPRATRAIVNGQERWMGMQLACHEIHDIIDKCDALDQRPTRSDKPPHMRGGPKHADRNN